MALLTLPPIPSSGRLVDAHSLASPFCPLAMCGSRTSSSITELQFPSFSKLQEAAFRQRANSALCSVSPKNEAGALTPAEPIFSPEVEAILDTIKWDSQGLAVAIAQHVDTGAILMQGFANRDAVSATLASGRATFYSRSRSTLWTKGETSFNFINVVDVFLDCDRDSIIYLGQPDGPTCHSGAETCYFTPASNIRKNIQDRAPRYAWTTLFSLENIIFKRKDELSGVLNSSSSKPSWTNKLLKDQRLLCSKIREEADELCRTLEDDEGKARTASEMADVLYHSMVLLALQDVKLKDVFAILRDRFRQSGIEEKSKREKDASISQENLVVDS